MCDISAIDRHGFDSEQMPRMQLALDLRLTAASTRQRVQHCAYRLALNS